MNKNYSEYLKEAEKYGIIDMSVVQRKIEMHKNQEILKNHPFAISQINDGRWMTYLPDKEKGRKPLKKKSREKLEAEIIKYWKEEAENPTIEEIFKEWNDRRLELKKISTSSHERYQQFYDRHYKEFGKKKIKSLEWQDFEEFLENEIAKHELDSKSYQGLKAVTKGLLQRAKKRKLIDFNVVTELAEMDMTEISFKKKKKEDNQEVYDELELEDLIEYLLEHLDIHNMGILLMVITGIRVGELVALKKSDIDGNTIKIRRIERRQKRTDGKGNDYIIKEFPKSEAGWREIVLPNDYKWLIEKLLSTKNDYLFCNDKNERMTTNCFRRRLEQVNKKIEAIQKSPHKLRKTYASILLDSNVDKNLVIQQMGHSDDLVTEKSYHRNRKTVEKKTAIISSIEEFKLKKAN